MNAHKLLAQQARGKPKWVRKFDTPLYFSDPGRLDHPGKGLVVLKEHNLKDPMRLPRDDGLPNDRVRDLELADALRSSLMYRRSPSVQKLVEARAPPPPPQWITARQTSQESPRPPPLPVQSSPCGT